jgi:hypothetical protein
MKVFKGPGIADKLFNSFLKDLLIVFFEKEFCKISYFLHFFVRKPGECLYRLLYQGLSGHKVLFSIKIRKKHIWLPAGFFQNPNTSTSSAQATNVLRATLMVADFYPCLSAFAQRSVSSAFRFFLERRYFDKLSTSATNAFQATLMVADFLSVLSAFAPAIRFIRVQVFFRTQILRQAQHKYHGCPAGNADGRGFFIRFIRVRAAIRFIRVQVLIRTRMPRMPFGQREWSRIFYPFYPRSRQRSVSSAFKYFFQNANATNAFQATRMVADFLSVFIRVRVSDPFHPRSIFFQNANTTDAFQATRMIADFLSVLSAFAQRSVSSAFRFFLER